MKFRCKNLLVTGGCGFIGSNFIKLILAKYSDLRVINLDKLTYAGSLENTSEFCSNQDYIFEKVDICNYNLVDNIFRKYSIDGVINFAAESHVDKSIENPDIFIQTNINGVYNLLNIAYKNWMISPFNKKQPYLDSRFHQISTDEVFGSISKGSFHENSPYKPNSPYSASKASADFLIRSFNKTYGLNTTISISSNNFGNNQNKEKFIPNILNCINSGKTVKIYGDGKNIRDWIHVEDNCKAIDLVFNKGKNGEKYNIGANNEWTNISLVKLIFKLAKKNPNLKFIEDRYGHDYRYSIDISKIKSDLGWSPDNNFKEKILNIIKKNS